MAVTTQSHQKPKVALGMSGGVDSSVCAHLLLEQGYDVTGVFLECWRAPGCRSEEDRKDALKVALELNIPFQVLDFKQAYKDRVVEVFFDEYQAGRTPNPDVACNREIKFGLFYDWAISAGFDFVATGHYAKIIEIEGQKELAIPKDTQKDQTYFLYPVSSEQLAHTLFPLQDFTKTEVRTEAEQRQLHVADKKDSVGICFIGDINVHDFLKERLGENPGEVIDTAGNVIGRHQGLWFYTVGQRHGFEIDKKTIVTQSDGTTVEKHNIPPFYVVAKKPEQNQLVVGFGTDVYTHEFLLTNPEWVTQPPINGDYLVRIRHTGQLLPARVALQSKNTWLINLTEPTKGVAAGQAVVIYQPKNKTTICLGGGIIDLP